MSILETVCIINILINDNDSLTLRRLLFTLTGKLEGHSTPGEGNLRILSLDGGGYLGLATASFLAELERHFNQTCHSRFDLFCGTSTGAIIALALASGMPAAKICDLYQSFGPKVFDNRFPGRKAYRLTRSMLGSMYDNSALRSTLNETFGDLTLQDLRQKGKQVLVPAFCLTTGRPRVFKTDHSPRLTTDDHYLLRDIALASSAAPVFLPTVDLKSPTTGIPERYCDGGVFANHPALIAYAEATSELGIAPCDIHILSVSTPRSDSAEHLSSTGFIRKVTLRRGLIFWGGPKLISLLIDSTFRYCRPSIETPRANRRSESCLLREGMFPEAPRTGT